MPVTLTIKNVPEQLAEQLRLLAAAHHRSLQGELMAIVEAVARQDEFGRKPAPFTGGQRPAPGQSMPEEPVTDGLIDQLDAIVAGSQWGNAPLLTRGQAHDRALAREFDYQAQEEQARYKP